MKQILVIILFLIPIPAYYFGMKYLLIFSISKLSTINEGFLTELGLFILSIICLFILFLTINFYKKWIWLIIDKLFTK
jgi:hypothetical protein